MDRTVMDASTNGILQLKGAPQGQGGAWDIPGYYTCATVKGRGFLAYRSQP